MNSDLDPYPQPVPPQGGPPLTIYVANMAEDVWQLIETLPPEHKTTDIRGCDLTSDRELSAFLGTPNFVLISPVAVDPTFISYIQSLKSKTYLEIIVPKVKTGQISLDILNDPQTIDRILYLSEGYSVRIESYTASKEFIDLVTLLQTKNPTITAPLTPTPQNKNVVDYFGSKSGLRNFYETNTSKDDDFVMSHGKVCTDKATAIAYAYDIYQSGEGVVFKTPKGHSGIGVVIVKKTDATVDFASLLLEPYWDHFPVIVEEYIAIDHSIGGGNPNAECLIDEHGKVSLLFYCGMRIDDKGGFQGIEIGENVLPKELVAKFKKIGHFLGENYASLGYKGYFDIDGMVDKNNRLYISESNVRRTGGTHVYYLAKTLLGDDFAQKYIVSNNYYALPQNNWSFTTMHNLLSPILYNPESKSGLIIAGANTLQDNFLSYIIIANTKEESVQIEARMSQLLQTRV